MIWWGLLGVLLIGFALTDGFDLGVAALLPFVARTDAERRMVINSIGATGKATKSGSSWAAVRSSRLGPSSMRSVFPVSILPCSWCSPR
jgi:hypothetical protein